MPYARGRSPLWHVTVLSRDGEEFISHTPCEDQKECQCVATIARSENLSTQIWIKPPAGRAYPWD